MKAQCSDLKLVDSGQFKQFQLFPDTPAYYGTATRAVIDKHVEAFQKGIHALNRQSTKAN